MLPHRISQLIEKILAANTASIFFLLTVVVLLPSVGAASAPKGGEAGLRQLIQLAEYIGADYIDAVKDGQVIDVDEYQEMVEFSELIVDKTRTTFEPTNENQSILSSASVLHTAVQTKQDIAEVRVSASELRRLLLELAPQSSLPNHLLPMAEITRTFQIHCGSCHGVTGHGDGMLAKGLNPPPTDFTDNKRAVNRSILGLYDAISNGIDGTSMPAFEQLTELQRWSLAFYIGSLAFQPTQDLHAPNGPVVSLQQFVDYSPAVLALELSKEQYDGLEHLRATPEQLFSKQKDPLSITRSQLKAALQAHQQGEYRNASSLAVSAYLDGFELIENNLDARDASLRKSIESSLIKLRQTLNSPQNDGVVEAHMANTLQQLDVAENLLTESALSNGTLFTASLVILLREGLEALLVVIALTTVLIRTNRQDALKYVHLGWISALLAGGATWAVAQSLITISGASREMMEGIAALLAAIVLFYVGIWMHSKTHAAHWQAYIKKHVDARLQSGALWGLAALAFIAVYREVFESVLFYQSLLTQAVSEQYSFIAGGVLSGTVILFSLAWLLIRYSIKLPIAQFFATTTYLVLALSFVLMGKAVSALQEAAVISISPMPIDFTIDWIGINSTWQGVSAQALVLITFAVFMLRSRSKHKIG